MPGFRVVVTDQVFPDVEVERELLAGIGAKLEVASGKLPQGDALVRAGGWGVGELGPIARLSELTVGLVGYGRIARRLAAALRAMGASVVAHDPLLERADDGTDLVGLDELLVGAQVVSLHCPLTPETRGLFDAERLRCMRRDAVLVNTSRGPIVVLHDLLQALREGVLAGAALDVYEREPPDPALLAGVSNLLVTPHVAFYSEAAVRESQRKAATQVTLVLTGEPPQYPVDG